MCNEQQNLLKQVPMLFYLPQPDMQHKNKSVCLQTFGLQCLLNKQKFKKIMFVQQTRDSYVDKKFMIDVKMFVFT